MEDTQNSAILDTAQRIELSEGVEVLLPIAGPFVRASAFLLDMIIIIIFISLLSFGSLFITFATADGFGDGLYLIVSFVMLWGYFYFQESGKHGATFGKKVMRLRVVDVSGGPATRGQVLARNLLRFVDMLPGIPYTSDGIFLGVYGTGLIACLFSSRFQRLGDFVANTVVVYTSSHSDLARLNKVPPSKKILPVAFKLNRDEQTALIDFQHRSSRWSRERSIELANHLSALTGKSGEQGLEDLYAMAQWLENRK